MYHMLHIGSSDDDGWSASGSDCLLAAATGGVLSKPLSLAEIFYLLICSVLIFQRLVFSYRIILMRFIEQGDLMSKQRKRRNRKNTEVRFNHIDVQQNEERENQCGKGSIFGGSMIKVFSAWGILSVFVSEFVKAIKIGFPWAWAQVSLANLSLIVPHLGVVAFLIMLSIPFWASRCTPAGCFDGRAKDNAPIVLLMFATMLPLLGTALFIACGVPLMGQWGVAALPIVFFATTVALICVFSFSIKRISEELPGDKDEARWKSAGDFISGLLVISLGCCSVLSGALSLSLVFDNTSADMLFFATSIIVVFVILIFIVVRNPRESENCIKRAVSAAAPRGIAEEKRGIAFLILGTIFVMVLSIYIGCAGLTNEYVIRSIGEERQVYRVVAELGGGRCVAVPMKEENEEWTDSDCIVSLNIFDGYQIIEGND